MEEKEKHNERDKQEWNEVHIVNWAKGKISKKIISSHKHQYKSAMKRKSQYNV